MAKIDKSKGKNRVFDFGLWAYYRLPMKSDFGLWPLDFGL